MNVLLDTNVLGRMAETGHIQHPAAVDAVAALVAQGDAPCLVPQVLYEFWVVATRPVSANGLGYPASQADVELSRLVGLYQLLLDKPASFAEWRRPVAAQSVIGKSAHDARLVAAMTLHGITHLLTFNTQHFTRFPGITAIDPKTIATKPPSP